MWQASFDRRDKLSDPSEDIVHCFGNTRGHEGITLQQGADVIPHADPAESSEFQSSGEGMGETGRKSHAIESMSGIANLSNAIGQIGRADEGRKGRIRASVSACNSWASNLMRASGRAVYAWRPLLRRPP